MVLLAVALPVAAAFQPRCKSVIFSDSTKVKRLFGKNVHGRVIPASTTKVMTALVVLDKMSLDSYVTVSDRASRAQPSKAYLKPGEQYKVRDLLYAILLSSSNDAAIVLAEGVAGSEWKFVQMMNQKAKQIGAKHTKFANASGLPTKKTTQYTTAYDMYLIFRKALTKPFFKEAIKLKYKTITSRGGRKISLKTHNKILFMNWARNVYGKTGYTHAAGACFVGTLQKGGSTLIIAVFNCQKRWDDIKNTISAYAGLKL